MASITPSLAATLRRCSRSQLIAGNLQNKCVTRWDSVAGRLGGLRSVSTCPCPSKPAQQPLESKDKQKSKITFEEYRKLKKKIMRGSRIVGLLTGFGSMTACSIGFFYLDPTMLSASPDDVKLIFGLDPLNVAMVSAVASGVGGYLTATSLTSLFWRSRHEDLNKWDPEFLERLEKHRFREVNAFDDDYYGDKVMTLSDYRQWIRRQHKKRDRFQTPTKSAQ